MRKVFIAAVVLLQIALSVHPDGNAAEMNFVKNGDFEEGLNKEGQPVNWQCQGKLSLSSDAYEGKHSLSSEDGYVVASQDFNIPKLAGKEVVISFYAKGTLTSKCGVILLFWDDDKFVQGSTLLWGENLNSGKFTPISVSYLLPESGKGKFMVNIYNTTGKGKIWLDKVSVAEIFRGDDSFLGLPYPEKTVTEGELAAKDNRKLIASGCKRRFYSDLKEVERKVEVSEISVRDKEEILEEAKKIAGQIEKFEYKDIPETFKAILPFNNLHKQIFKLNAKVLSAKGFPSLFVWYKAHDAPLDLFEEPTGGFPDLKVIMMQNEYRATAFNITNATPESIKLKFRIEGLPRGNPGFITPYQVEYVDTHDGRVIHSALTNLIEKEGFYTTEVFSGMTRQIWLSFHPKTIVPGDYQGSLLINASNLKKRLPFKFSLFPIVFPEKTDFSFQTWDYSSDSVYCIGPENQKQAIESLQTHFVNVTWSARSIVPWPKTDDVDINGNLTRQPDFSKFDKWVKMWPDAQHYILFDYTLGPGGPFLGKKIDSEAFHTLVSQWAEVWAKHNREIGLKPGQVCFMPVDEPINEENYKVYLYWAKAIKARTKEISLFVDPPIAFSEVWNRNYAVEVFNYCDIICPAYTRYEEEGQKAQDFYKELQQKDKLLWFYNAVSARWVDPCYYFRFAPWRCYLYGVTGGGDFSFAAAGCPDSWNEFLYPGAICMSPVYITPRTITTSKHWEAAREGIEDYQYFKMLEDKIASLKEKGIRNAFVSESSRLLKMLPQEVSDKIASEPENGYSFMEDARIRILNLLTEPDKL